MSKQVIVGFNGTNSSAEALRWAADEADVRGVGLRVVSCFDLPTAADALIGFGYAEAITLIDRKTCPQGRHDPLGQRLDPRTLR